jgi:hypothetical protein
VIAIISRNHVLIRLLPSRRRMEFSEATWVRGRERLNVKSVFLALNSASLLLELADYHWRAHVI